jgi:hypothetical protein
MKTTQDNDTSPNHTWAPIPYPPYMGRVQWRKDKHRACVAQFNAGHEMFHELGLHKPKPRPPQ